MHKINSQPESDVRVSMLLINSEPEDKRFMNGKLPVTKAKGCKFVVYNIMAMVYMIMYHFVWADQREK